MNKKNNQLNNQPVPKKNEIKNKSNNRNATGVVLQHQSAYQYQGPIPPPEMMEKYKNIYADAPKIILQEFKENSEHIRQKELLEVQGTINRDRRGQWMAFVICMAILGVVFYSLYLGNITFAGLSGLGFIALIATGILKKIKCDKNSVQQCCFSLPKKRIRDMTKMERWLAYFANQLIPS